MKIIINAKTRRNLVFCFVILGLAAAFFIAPFQLPSEAGDKNLLAGGNINGNEAGKEGLPNYDIRTDKGATDKLFGLRRTQNKSAVEVADVRDTFV
ncbi:MAG TPA: hypothetical protein VGD05_07010, partial [Pyrinomonadaceae bacterium]